MTPNEARPRRLLAAVTSAALLVCALCAVAAADHPVGPPIGNNRFKTAIETGPQGVDQDDYTAVLAAGDRLSFSVRSPFQSPLLPEIQLLDPDGRDRTAEARVRERSGGKKLIVKRFEVDRTGVWAVRIRGRIATEGTYVVAFKVAGPRRSRLDELQLGGDAGDERTHVLEAVEGSTLDVDVAWGNGRPVEIVAVLDPAGREVLDGDGRGASDVVRAKRKRAVLKRLPLSGGDGAYAIRLRAPDGPTSYRIRWRVRAPRRPGGLRKLSSVEPHIIAPQIVPLLGVEGTRLRIDGWNLSTGEAPRVLFGSVAGRDVIVDPSGGFLDVTVPPGDDGATVSVAVVNPDGQASVADGLFHYVPPPVISDVVRVDGAPFRGGDAEGGDLVRILGEHLRTGQLVRFGNGREIVPILRDGDLELVTRAQAPGKVSVFVTDSFGHEAVSPVEYEFKAVPTFDASPYIPAVAGTDGDTDVIVRGTGFEASDELTFDGEPIAFERLSPTLLRIRPPARSDGPYPVGIRDRFGLAATAPALRIKAPGMVDAVTPVAGAWLGDDDVSLHGGTTLRLDGSRFHDGDVVEVGSSSAEVTSATATRLDVLTPAGSAGTVDLVVRDLLGQETVVEGAVRYVGYRDLSAARAPARTGLDDRSAARGAVADLDDDGDVDDLVIVSRGSVGTRAVRTRLFLGSSGALTDVTATRVPAAGSDASGQDDLRASAVAIGDLDGADGPDILLAGEHPAGGTYGEVRWLQNDGTGDFDLAEDDVPSGRFRARVTAIDENEVEHEVWSARTVRGLPTALAIGDLDGDDDLDVVVGRSSHESRRRGVAEAVVDFDQVPAYVTAAAAAANEIDVTYHYPAVRVLDNRVDLGDGLVDVTESEERVPSAGDDDDTTPRPAFPCRDLALADLDGDDDLDLVLTWDDPTTVTAYGLAGGSGTDSARLATRVLLNDGDGAFTDATDDWMPAGVSPEWYQGTRVVLTDLDGDGDPDLLVAHDEGVDAYQGPATYTRLALRVLRNDHSPQTATGGFTDVSASVLPALGSATNENHRARTLVVADVDGDGVLDLLLGSVSPPTTRSTGAALPATRLLSGTSGTLRFRDNSGFLPPVAAESGEADDLLLIPDLSPETQPSLILVTETVPAASAGSRLLRVLDWQR